jgi:hypothetical protein
VADKSLPPILAATESGSVSSQGKPRPRRDLRIPESRGLLVAPRVL